MRSATTITTKGQVVIPKPVRTRLRWRSGTRLSVEIIDNNAVRLSASAEPVDDPIERAFGLLTEGDALTALEAEHRAEIERDDHRRR